MATAGVNLPGVLPLGNLATTTQVTLGLGPVVTINNTASTPSFAVSGPVSTTGVVTLPNGSASAPALAFTSATSSGLSTPSAGTLSVSVAGAAVQDWTAQGPIALTHYGQWTSGTVGTTASTTAIAFGSQTSPTSPASASLTGFLTYAASAANGDTWTVNQTGLWSIKAVLNVVGGGGTAQAYISRNSVSTLTPTAGNLTAAITLDYNTAGQTGTQMVTTGGSFALAAGDVVRVHIAAANAAVAVGTAAACFINIAFLGASAATL